jgi:Putative Ig domain
LQVRDRISTLYPESFVTEPINLSLLPFEFKLGGIDVTRNTVELRLKRPEISLPTPQKTTISFTLVTVEEDHDKQKLNPDIHSEFCPLVLECTLKVEGILVFTGYINEFKYDELTLSATGTLIDSIEYLSYDRAAAEIKDIEIGTGTPVGTAVKRLLVEAGKDFTGTQIYAESRIAEPSLSGVFSSPLVSSSPAGDAQKYASPDLLWMYCLPNGDIGWKKYPTDGSPSDGSPLFRRSLAELGTFQNDPYAFPIMATKVCVRGSHEEAKPNEDAADLPPTPLLRVTTITRQPAGVIANKFANPPATLPNPLALEISEEKTIDYVYRFTSNNELEETVTTSRQPAGVVSANFNPPPTLPNPFALTEASITKETSTRKEELRPMGAIAAETPNPQTVPNPLALSTYRLEEVQDQNAFLAHQKQNNPPRDNSPPAPFSVETVPVCGCAIASSTCISPFLKRPHYEDVGYLYNQAQATALAQWMVTRAVHLYKSYLIEMPPPLEWLQDPSPFTICDIHNRRWIMEVPELVLSATDGICKLIFRGLPISFIEPVPFPPEIIPFVPPLNILAIAPVSPRIFTVGYAIAPIANVAVNGTQPYTWSATLPTGLSINPTTGVISGTPTVVSAIVDYTITVTDSLSAPATTDISIEVKALPITNPIVQIKSENEFGRKRGLLVTNRAVLRESVFVGRKRGLIVATDVYPPEFVLPANDNYANRTSLLFDTGGPG